MKQITNNKLERLEVTIVYICIAVLGEKLLFGPHGGFGCSTASGHWEKKIAKAPCCQSGVLPLMYP